MCFGKNVWLILKNTQTRNFESQIWKSFTYFINTLPVSHKAPQGSYVRDVGMYIHMYTNNVFFKKKVARGGERTRVLLI
jgi:hypothetical protein